MRTFLTLCLAVVFLAACAPGGGSSTNDAAPADRLAAAKRQLDDATNIGFTIKADPAPSGTALVSASGTGTHAPTFKGDVTVTSSGTEVNAPIIALDGEVYAQLPFVGWKNLETEDYGAPDPAALMSTDAGISSLFTATQKPQAGEQTRDGEEVLTDIKGTLPGAAVKRLFPSTGTGTFTVTYALTDDDQPHRITITGPFYEGRPAVTYVMTLDLDAEAVQVEAPI